jgi:hypothetical protein
MIQVGFTPEVSETKTNLKTLYASGGGDGPEAVTAALYAVTEMVSDGVCRQFGRPPDSLTTLTYRNGGREQQEWQSSLLMHLLMASEK